MKRKRKNMAKRETAKTNNDKSYYKNFVIPCVIFFCRILLFCTQWYLLFGLYFCSRNPIHCRFRSRNKMSH